MRSMIITDKIRYGKKIDKVGIKFYNYEGRINPTFEGLNFHYLGCKFLQKINPIRSI